MTVKEIQEKVEVPKKGYRNYYMGTRMHHKKLIKTDERIGTKKIGRNDFCPCGSGVKFKKCCLK